MKVKYNQDYGSKKAGQVIDINAYYVADLIKQGIVSPVNGGTLPPASEEPTETIAEEKPKRRKK